MTTKSTASNARRMVMCVCDSLDPILVQQAPAGVKLLCGQFAFNASAVLTGDNDGSVHVYSLQGFEQHPDDQVTAVDLSVGVVHNTITTFTTVSKATHLCTDQEMVK